MPGLVLTQTIKNLPHVACFCAAYEASRYVAYHRLSSGLLIFEMLPGVTFV